MMFVHYVINYLFIGNFANGHVPISQPSFKSMPMTIKSEENETIFLPCVVDNLGNSFIRWWKGEVLLWDASTLTITILPKFTFLEDGMTVDSLEPEDAGDYTCEVVRPEPWSSLKLTHKVQVMYPPRLMPSPPDGYLEVRLGEKIKIGCSAMGTPAPVIKWRTKSVDMELTGEKLEFMAASRLMSGIYQCEASNGIGKPVHTNIFVRVLHKPEVSAEKSWIHTAPGIKTSLVCRIVADPEASVEWLFEGVPLKTSTSPGLMYQVRGDDHILLLKSVSVSDFGNYTCRATNEMGTTEDSMELTGVANAATFSKVESKTPEDFTLIWEVDSYSPIFEYKLLFRKRETEERKWVSVIIPPDGSSSGPLHSKSFTISGLDKFSVYEAKILSRNRFGWSSPSDVVTFGLMKARVTEEDKPTEEVFADSEISGSPRSRAVATIVFLLPVTFTLCRCICDIS